MVKAEAVVSISDDFPRSDDRFFVDTNVWISFTYQAETATDNSHNRDQAQVYSSFIKKCRAARAMLHWSPLTYQELAHHIETNKFQVCRNQRAPDEKVWLKKFRGWSDQRKAVVESVRASWDAITTLGTVLPTPTDADNLAAAVKAFEQYPLDGYDCFFVNAMKRAGVTAIVTDDIDFTRVPGLKVFTANKQALKEAAWTKKLLKR